MVLPSVLFLITETEHSPCKKGHKALSLPLTPPPNNPTGRLAHVLTTTRARAHGTHVVARNSFSKLKIVPSTSLWCQHPRATSFLLKEMGRIWVCYRFLSLPLFVGIYVAPSSLPLEIIQRWETRPGIFALVQVPA